jgi:hypothetical protein
MLKALLKTMRPKQWTKNVSVFAALVFDRKLTQMDALQSSILAFVFFCLISSTVYSLRLIDQMSVVVIPAAIMGCLLHTFSAPNLPSLSGQPLMKEIHTGLFATMDGTTAGSGAGPRTMDSHRKNVILASTGQVAIDAVAAQR